MKVPTLVVTLALSVGAASQNRTPENPNDMPGMDMSHAQSMPDMPSRGGAAAMHAMEGHHMDMGPHMKMTGLRPLHPGDQQRAEKVAVAARSVAEKYRDYKVALADGYRIFLPDVPQKMYHFTNYQ